MDTDQGAAPDNNSDALRSIAAGELGPNFNLNNSPKEPNNYNLVNSIKF